MKNKIFLTSALAILMTCPALATGIIASDATSANCLGVPIDNMTDGSVAYTAQWGACTANVQYFCGAGGGSSAPSSTSVTTAVPFTTAAAPDGCSDGGHTFSYWLCNYSLANTAQVDTPYPDSELIQSPKVPCASDPTQTITIECTAQWSTNGYTISYANNASSLVSGTTVSNMPSSAESVVYGGSFALSASEPTAPGYEFAGWDCPNLPATPTLPANDPQYFEPEASGTYNITSSVVCTAQWTPKVIALTWDDDNGSVTSVNDSLNQCTYGVLNGISGISEPERTGYRFLGWEAVGTPAQ